MPITFAQPQALGLLLSLPLFYLVGRDRLARLPVGARRVALATRFAIVSLVVLALAQPSLIHPNDNLAVVFAVDASDSVSPEVRDAAESWVRQAMRALTPKDQAAVISFGAEARIEKGFGAPLAGESGQPRTDGTNVAQALHLAQAIFPAVGGRRIVLLTDGLENSGRAEEEARYLAQQGIQISVVPLASQQELREVLIESVDAPAYLRQGDAFRLTISVYSTYETDAVVQVFVDNRQVSEEVKHLHVGGNSFSLDLTASSQGYHTFRARVDAAGDTYPQNNEGWAYTVVKAPGKVLAIANRAEDLQPLRQALTATGLDVEAQPPGFIPPRLTPLSSYDGLLLVNVPASSLSFDQMKTVTSFVRSLGRGLVVVGGDSSLSLGNYIDTPLAEALPVLMNVPGGVERGNVGMLLVVDKSGSMDANEEGVKKVAMARDAAQKAVALLESPDVVGVIAFDTSSQVLVEPQAIGTPANRQKIQDLISRLEASGGTDIRQALERAMNLMPSVRTRYRHIILLSDGRPNQDARYDDLIQRMRNGKVTLSTIAIGSDADLALMQELAQQGGGRYYYAEKAKDVPQITMREARIASGAASVEGTFRPQAPSAGTDSPLLRSLRYDQLPAVTGYVVTVPKDTAHVALISEREDPLLAHWQYGLGRVVTWTSDVTPKWAADWLTWPGLAQFWSQTVRWSLRSPADPNLQVSSSVRGRHVTIRVDAADDDGVFQDLLDVRARVLTSEGQSDELRLEQTRPGRYETAFAVAAEGAYELDVTQHQGDAVVREETAGFVVPYPPEYRRFGLDAEFLARLAALGGGQVLREPREAFRRDILFEGQMRLPLWPWLLTAATVLFPLDVGVRRLKISPAYLRRRLWVPFVEAAVRLNQVPGRVVYFIRKHRPR